jgi:glyoxylase-like metal-dependent hydrolase (beta-lactamase superfamily II)
MGKTRCRSRKLRNGQKKILMPGTWTATRTGLPTIHTFTAPEDGWLVTSHIIELPSQFLVVDAQYTLAYAREVARYAAALNKPLTRLYVTHYHPDHLLGAAVFDAPLLTLAGVAEKIAAAGDRVAREEHEKVGNDIPTKARQPDRRIEEGEEIVDGVRIEHRRLHSAETEDALIVALPDAGAIIVQDLVYDRAHLFLGERQFEGWRTALRQHRDLPYDIVLPGHGTPGDKALYDTMIDYLDFAEKALKQSTTAAEFKRRLLAHYPDYGGGNLVDHQLRFLFP